MLEHISNNSMYTTIPPSIDWCEEKTYDDYIDTVDFLIEHNRSFIEEEEKELEDLLKHEPRE